MVFFAGGFDVATDVHVDQNCSPFRFDGFEEIFEDKFGNGFVEYFDVSKGVYIELEGFQFEAFVARNIGEGDGSEIGVVGKWANGGEFRRTDGYPVLILRQFLESEGSEWGF